MTYVIDTNSLIHLGRFFPSRFPTLWANIDSLIAQNRLVSTREVRRELTDLGQTDHISQWAKSHAGFFLTPGAGETQFVATILATQPFGSVISRQAILKGKPVADPFVVALAHQTKATVVTEEVFKPASSKIPNVCKHFGVNCINLEQMMSTEGWSF